MPTSGSRPVFIGTASVLLLLVVVAFSASACSETGEEAASTTTATTIAITPSAPSTAETAATVTSAAGTTSSTVRVFEEFIFGIVLAGPYNDRGWSQAHYQGGLYVARKLPDTKMVYVDKANSRDRPDTTAEQLAEELLAQGAQMIFFTSADMKDSAVAFAEAHPDIPVVHCSGDSAWKGAKDFKDLPNLSNIMGRMEYGQMIAGVAAALTTETGKIGYLGPLINNKTRRLAASAYLGAKYAWTEYLGKDPAALEFSVDWIDFWFNLPGLTSDPTQVANDFFNQGFDVVISGIDTTEALVEAGRLAATGRHVWAIPYNYVGSLSEARDVALGVPYFNWGPEYLNAVSAAREEQWSSFFLWIGPDWNDINNPATSMIGFVKGKALPSAASARVDRFVDALTHGLNLWTGPLNLQDGTPYLAEGEVATDQQIWYLPQLLEGMEGQSTSAP